MEEKDFIIEAIKRLLPDTSWYGETYHDKKAVENLDIVESVLNTVFENVSDNFYCKREGNYSSMKLTEKSREILINFVDENIDIFKDIMKELERKQ